MEEFSRNNQWVEIPLGMMNILTCLCSLYTKHWQPPWAAVMPILCLLQLQTFCPGSADIQTSGFSSFPFGSYSETKTWIHPHSDQKLHLEPNFKYKFYMQNFSCWWSRSTYIYIKLFLFITKTIKSQTTTKARAVGHSFLLEVELGRNSIHMKSDMKPPGCHDILYITVNSMH